MDVRLVEGLVVVELPSCSALSATGLTLFVTLLRLSIKLALDRHGHKRQDNPSSKHVISLILWRSVAEDIRTGGSLVQDLSCQLAPRPNEGGFDNLREPCIDRTA